MTALRNFRIWQKLSAVVVLMAIPLGFMTWAYVTSASSQIAFAEKEISGTQYLRPLRSLAQRMAEHRGLSAAYLNGTTVFGARIEASAAHIDRIIAEVDSTPAEVVETLDTAARWSTIKSTWRSLGQGGLELAAVDNFERHSALIGQIIDLSAYVGDTSNLILDPDLDSFYLMDIVVTRLVVLNDMLGVLRGKGAAIASNPALAPQRLRQLDGLDLDGRARDLAAAVARSVKTAIRNNATLGAALDGKLAAFEREYTGFMRLMKDDLFDASVIAVPAPQVFDAGSRAIDAGYAVYDAASPLLEQLLAKRVEHMHGQMLVRIGEVALCLVVALALAAWLVTGISRGFARAAALANSVADGNLDNVIDTDGGDEIGQLLCALAAMQAGLRKRRDSDLQVAAEIGRLKQALDNVTANVMVADAEHNIIYMNKAVTALMREAESDLRQQLKNFDANRLVGTNIDDFHVDPAHQRRLLGRLTDTHSGSMRIGPRTLRITANPVIDASGERLGTVVEWADLTAELAIEAEVSEIVTAARAGDLSQRIAVAGKSGFYEALSNGINSLVEVVDDTVSDTVRVVGALAAGDLSQSIERQYQGAFGQLKDDTNTTVVKLMQVIGEIKRVAASVRCGAEEISQGNSSLSQRTEQQASSLEETAASMEQMTATVKQNADNANQANQLAVSAREQAEKGGAVVGQAVEAMGGINTASKKIADIISVIDEIAFQTNLLALNAAVEAARAGEQGRGFAVVASEVRNLAQRSATAAKEIKALIEDSVQRVEGGSKLVQASGETLDGIVTAVKKVSDIIADIAAASSEQSSGIEQVNRAVMHLDEMTQQNAALVEEAASASQSMGEQARGMVELVSFFHAADEALAGPADALPVATGTAERRGVQRPWTSDDPAAGSAPAGSAASRRASAAGDDEWEEF